MKVEYPESFYRGISHFAIRDGYLLPEAFHLDSGRNDGFVESSITWNDNQDSFRVIASQRSDGIIQFDIGIAEITMLDFLDAMHPHLIINNISYERKPTKDNKYHGNILLKENLDKSIKNMIKGQLALLAQRRIHNNPFCT